MSTEPRVVVTGLGIISPLGLGVEAHWKGLLAGRSGVGPISLFDPGDFDVQVAAEVQGFNARKMVPQRKAIKVMASRMKGKAICMSAIRINTVSGHPPRYPATRPKNTPISPARRTETQPTIRETRAP